MNERKPSFFERVIAAMRRWADERRRIAEDRQYWQDAQHDARLVVDITRAAGRSELERPATPSRRWKPAWSMLAPLMTRREVVEPRPSAFHGI